MNAECKRSPEARDGRQASHATAVRPSDVAERGNVWAIVLAGGDGTRLAAVTADAAGRVVPKQYCSVDGRRSLLGTTLERAARLAPASRTVVVVARHHECWWRTALDGLPRDNVLVQPCPRGTAAGLLYPALAILRREPRARLVVLPSDHHVADEDALTDALVEALGCSRDHAGRPVLLGMQADGPDTGYGWIVPARDGAERSARIAEFVEKPAAARAADLYRQGALWSSFLFAASAGALVGSYARAVPGLLRAFAGALAGAAGRKSPDGRDDLDELYARISSFDFSRDVLEAEAGAARVLPVTGTGWSDLGTPERLAGVAGLTGPLVERARGLLRSRPAPASLPTRGRVAARTPAPAFARSFQASG